MRYLLILIFVLVGCKSERNQGDKAEALQTEQMAAEAAKRVGPPGITNFTEKRFAKMIYELRDKEVKTYSYYLDLNGRKHFLCNSIGYGLPASVQYVNPMKPIKGYPAAVQESTIPQPEPNGLFMPDSLSATYVLCIDKKGKIHPVYFEPLLIVSPFKLD